MSHPEHEETETPALPELAALRQPRQPANDLWPGIAARLPPAALAARPTPRSRRQPRRWPAALAASLSVAVLAGLLLPQLALNLLPQSLHQRVQAAVGSFSAADFERENLLAALPGFGSEAPVELASAPEADSPHLAAVTPQSQHYPTLRSETDDWREQRGLMHAAFRAAPAPARASHAALPYGSEGQKTLLKANLRLMRDAEREIRRALRQEPESESLQEMLTQIRQQQAAVQRLLVADRR